MPVTAALFLTFVRTINYILPYTLYLVLLLLFECNHKCSFNLH